MVIARSQNSSLDRARTRERGLLMVDLVVGMAILTLAVIPLAFPFAHERQLLRN